MHRYLELANETHDESTGAELLSLFAPDALVNLIGEPVQGIQNIREFFEKFMAGKAASHYLWEFTDVNEKSAAAEWGVVIKTLDGQIITAQGTEVAHFDSDGRITSLVNTPR